MCCGTGSHYGGGPWGHHHGSCCCGGLFHFGLRFWTKKEKIAWLEEYLEGLREEVKAVGERIAALKGEE
jgi:hypothetical protein